MKIRLLTILLLGTTLLGCGQVSRMGANLTGNSIECVHGVQYIQFPSGVTVMYNQDGTVKTCNGG